MAKNPNSNTNPTTPIMGGQQPAGVCLRFVRTYNNYGAGDVACFQPELAKRILEFKDVAVPHTPSTKESASKPVPSPEPKPQP